MGQHPARWTRKRGIEKPTPIIQKSGAGVSLLCGWLARTEYPMRPVIERIICQYTKKCLQGFIVHFYKVVNYVDVACSYQNSNHTILFDFNNFSDITQERANSYPYQIPG